MPCAPHSGLQQRRADPASVDACEEKTLITGRARHALHKQRKERWSEDRHPSAMLSAARHCRASGCKVGQMAAKEGSN